MGRWARRLAEPVTGRHSPDMNSFLVLLAQVSAEVAVETDPDSVVTRQALLLALHAGVNAPREGETRARWDRYAQILAEADRELQAGLRDPVGLVEANVPPIGALDEDGEPLRTNVVVLTRQLGDLFDAAATAGQGSPWRQIVWAKVAECLSDAADELA
jgi:hypothetical protein